MKLKTRVATLEEVPEQYRDKYVQAEDGKSWALEEIELEDTTGLKKSHTKLLSQYKEAEEKLKTLEEQFADIDPAKAREAQKKLEEMENQELMDAGKFEELFVKRTQAMKQDHDVQVSQLSKKIEVETARALELEKRLQHTMISNQLSLEAPKMGVAPEMIPFLQLAVERDWVLDEEKRPVWRGADGQVQFGKDPSKPATMTDYLASMIEKVPALVKGNQGTGANGNNRPTGPISISKADLQNNPGKYAQVKALAEKHGIPVSQIQVTE